MWESSQPSCSACSCSTDFCAGASCAAGSVYRLTPRQQRAFGAAAFQVESLMQPEKRHVYEMKQAAEVYREVR